MLQIEAPRSDYRELVLHHINTLLLISLSYAFNYTRIGNAIFVCMDLPDVLLAVSPFFFSQAYYDTINIGVLNDVYHFSLTLAGEIVQLPQLPVLMRFTILHHVVYMDLH